MKCRAVVSGCFVSLKCKRLLKPDLLFCIRVLCPLVAACLSEAAVSWLDSPCEWIAAQLLTNSPHSPLRKHRVTTPCVQSVGGGEQGGAGWVNRMGGWGGRAGVVAAYCLTDSGTARGNGWSWPRGQCLKTRCLSAKPPLWGRVGNPLQPAITGMIHAFIMTWETARWKHGLGWDVMLVLLRQRC